VPDTQRPEYNPFIMGFTRDSGPLIISLKEARQRYGKLPSDYRLVPRKSGRKVKKALNLDIGQVVSATLKANPESLKRYGIDFFNQWHRSDEEEFNIRTAPFLNLNDPAVVWETIQTNEALLTALVNLDLREDVLQAGLIRKDVLNSIEPERLTETVQQILQKKLRQAPQSPRAKAFHTTLTKVRAHAALQSMRRTIGMAGEGFTPAIVSIYADIIAETLRQVAGFCPLAGTKRLQTVQGQGVEVKFALRDRSYLALGKETGDCTADKPLFQTDQDVENIYWTVFPWILDRNYQILKVYFDGEFIMKAHILPLYRPTPGGGRMILAIDAIETVRAFRDDLDAHGREELISRQDRILQCMLAQVIQIAQKMGIDDVYAEKFSNTPWVREALGQLPEIFLNVNDLVKLDELEDIYELAQTLSRESGHPGVNDIFMELQMKNTSLLPNSTQKIKGIKSFAVVQGDASDGIPIKRVVGI